MLVRTELERSGRRNEELEDLAKSLNQQIEGHKGHIKSLGEEHHTLLEKCVASEENISTLESEKDKLKQKIQEMVTALHDLGRENQTLQMFQSRQNDRKWERDEEVKVCRTCNKKFTINNRRHHCRNCGHIYCAQCASQNYHLPSSKKPVRVCNTCYRELSSR